METGIITHIFHICHTSDATHWVVAAAFTHSLAILCISGSLYSVYWWDTHLMMVVSAGVFNFISGICLKYLFGVQRRLENCGMGHAMPSSHTFLATFLVVYFSYLFYEASKYENAQVWRLRGRILLNFVYLATLSYAKVYIGHNTWQDVSMGWILGLVYTFGFAWMMHSMLDASERMHYREEKND